MIEGLQGKAGDEVVARGSRHEWHRTRPVAQSEWCMSCAQGWVLSAATLVIAPGCSGDGAELQGSTGRGSITARATACAADALEPSSSAALPRHLSVGEALTGRACPNEPDVFLLDTSERAGELLQVHLTQLQGLMNLDHSTLEYPCVSFGEIGAASAVAALCLGARAFVKGYSVGDRALVLSIGDRGQVSAILLQSAR